MKYIFHPEALTEYAEAVCYYADRRVEIGQAFIDAIEDAISACLQVRADLGLPLTMETRQVEVTL